jgi:4-amino-4-deoxy-L-arabinose transferase-like glycosyltransferase
MKRSHKDLTLTKDSFPVQSESRAVTEPISIQRWSLITLILIVWGVGLVVRLIFASTADHPGHGDPAFYYTVAENLAEGKGLQVDYIWNYLSNPQSIPHPSNDYWMPLTSIIISLSMRLFGKSLFAAILPSVLIGWALSALTYFIGRAYSGSNFVAVCSAGLVLFVSPLFLQSLLTDSTIYYVLFVCLSLFLAFIGRTRDPRFFLLAAFCSGLAQLTRQDGILLFLTIVLVILLSPLDSKRKAILAGLALGVHLMIVSPLIIDNYRTFSAPFPPGPSKTMFLRQYEDLYSYSKQLTPKTYLNWGIPNILASKFIVAVSNTVALSGFLDHFLWIFVIAGILNIGFSPIKRGTREFHLPIFLFLGILFAFYTLIATFPGQFGGFQRSSMSVVPFLIVIAVNAIDRNIPSRIIILLSIIVIGFLFFYQSILAARAVIGFNTRIGEDLAMLKSLIASEAQEQGQEDIVIMTRNPWEVYHSTRYKAIQIPNEDLDTIYEVAQEFQANYLLLPAERDALVDLYEGRVTELCGTLLRLLVQSGWFSSCIWSSLCVERAAP